MLSAYHQKWMSKSDEAIRHMVSVKEEIFRHVFAEAAKPEIHGTAKVAIFGCKERRMVAMHKELFSALLGVPVEQTTFDITVEHLEGAEGVVRHDVSEPVPGGPYQFVFADVVVRFLPPERQYRVVRNAWDALAAGGVAAIAFQWQDVHPEAGYVPAEGTFRVDAPALEGALRADGIAFRWVETDFETVPPGAPGPIRIDDAVLVLRKP